MPSQPRQKIIFDSPGRHMIQYLIYCTVFSSRHRPQLFHIFCIKIGDSPAPDLPLFFQLLHTCHRLLQRNSASPVKQVQIKIIRSHTLQTCHTAFKYVFPSCIVRINLGNQKQVTSVHLPYGLSNQKLCLSASIHFCCVNQCHTCADPCCQRFLLSQLICLLFPQKPGSLTQGRNLRPVRQNYIMFHRILHFFLCYFILKLLIFSFRYAPCGRFCLQRLRKVPPRAPEPLRYP